MRRLFYRILLQMYPRGARAAFGRDMELAFDALCREQRGNVPGLVAVYASEAVDAVRAGLQQRREVRSAVTPVGLGRVGGGGGAALPARVSLHIARAIAEVAADVRLAGRSLRHSLGFTAVVVVTLALGIGANSAVFGLVDATLLRPLQGVADADGLVVAYDFTRGRHGAASYPDYRDLGGVEAFAGLAASTIQPVVLNHDGSSERLTGQLISGNYFDVLGARPTLGRGVRADEEEGFGAHPVAVLSHALWVRRFASDPAVLGRAVQLNGRAFEIVGVAAPGFRGHGIDATPDLWVPMVMIGALTDLPFGDEVLDFRGLMMFSMVGRLRHGTGIESAQAAVDLRAVAIEQAAPGMFDNPREFLLLPARQAAFRPEARAEVTRYAGLLFAATAGLLLVTCINVAGLYSVRATGRHREIAVRMALGAGRRRVVQQLLTEALLLSILAGAGAVLVAFCSLPLLERLHLPAGVDPQLVLDARLLAFNIALATLTGLVFGAAPAFGASGRGAAVVLREVAAGARRWRGIEVRSALIVTQVAVTVLLLVGAGLLTRSLINLWSVDHGFDADNVLVASFDLQRAGYEEGQGRIFLRDITARAEVIAGVRSASVSADVPLGGVAGSLPLHIDGLRELEPGTVRQSLVGAGFFATLGVPLAVGREFDEFDREGGTAVVIVNRALADLAWPGATALGKQVRGGPQGPISVVVGVVGDYRHDGLRQEPGPRIYWPIEQQYAFAKGSTTRRVLVRTDGPPLAMAAALRTVVRDLDAELPVFDVVDMRQHIAASITLERQSAALVSAFGILALLLSAVGLFGVLAFTVAQRRREIGIRCALGAQGAQVAGGIVRGGLRLTGLGIAAGLSAALASGRVLASWLYDVQPFDPATYIFITLLMLTVAALASFVPARRATRIDAAVILRGD